MQITSRVKPSGTHELVSTSSSRLAGLGITLTPVPGVLARHQGPGGHRGCDCYSTRRTGCQEGDPLPQGNTILPLQKQALRMHVQNGSYIVIRSAMDGSKVSHHRFGGDTILKHPPQVQTNPDGSSIVSYPNGNKALIPLIATSAPAMS